MKLTDERLLEVCGIYGLGETQESILAELDDTEWMTVTQLADLLGYGSVNMGSKIKRMERGGLVDIAWESLHGGRRRLVRLPKTWPTPRSDDGD